MERSLFGFSGSLDDLASIDEELKGFLADLDNQNYAQPFLAAGGDDQMTDIFDEFLGGPTNEAAAPALQQAAPAGTSLPANMPPGPSLGSLQQQMLGATQASWPSMTTSAPVAAAAPASSAPTSAAPFFLDLPTQAPANFSRTITTGDTHSIPQQQPSSASLSYHQLSAQSFPPAGTPLQQQAWQPFGSLQPAAAPVQIKLESSGSGGAGGGSSGPGRKRRPGARKDPHKQKQDELTQQIQAMMAQLELLQSENERLKMKHQVGHASRAAGCGLSSRCSEPVANNLTVPVAPASTPPQDHLQLPGGYQGLLDVTASPVAAGKSDKQLSHAEVA
jgi:hypothetical protein